MTPATRDNERYTVGIVGATGLVGREVARLLDERRFPVDELRLFATEDSEGVKVPVGDDEVPVRPLRSGWDDRLDLLFVAVPAEVAAGVAAQAAEKGIAVIDVSAAHRHDPDALLCVPEVNGAALEDHGGIIASPSAAVAPLAVALAAAIDPRAISRLVVTAMLPASEAGAPGMEELSSQSIALFNQSEVPLERFPERLAFNALAQVGALDGEGEADTEAALRTELQRVLAAPALEVVATVVRIPIFSGQAATVVADCRVDVDRAGLAKRLADAEGVDLADEGDGDTVPMPGFVSEMDDVQVGRLRVHGPRTFSMWVVSDNLRKGSALNAVHIAERLVADGLL